LDFVRGNFELPNLGFGVAEGLTHASFTEVIKDQAQQLTDNVRQALISHIETSNWMDAKTKVNAKKKADQLLALIAYPDFTTDLSAMNAYYKGRRLL
jgi:predicted metalloendopeptidase